MVAAESEFLEPADLPTCEAEEQSPKRCGSSHWMRPRSRYRASLESERDYVDELDASPTGGSLAARAEAQQDLGQERIIEAVGLLLLAVAGTFDL